VVGDLRLPATAGRWRVTAYAASGPDLVVAAKKQTVFELGPADGVVVGFRFPAFFKSLNVPGYHLHFLSKTK
jgi:acetolactate decarboxylase